MWDFYSDALYLKEFIAEAVAWGISKAFPAKEGS